MKNVNSNNNSATAKWLAMAAMVLAIIYIIMPIDFDGPAIGIIDDFFFFMAAFCLCQSCFISSEKKTARRSLRRLSLIFACLGIAWLAVLAIIITI